MAVRRLAATALLSALLAAPAAAQTPAPAAPPLAKAEAPAAAAKPTLPTQPDDAGPDVWIFSGVLRETSESYSGTLITGRSDTQFELKLGSGATCDGGDLQPTLGLVKLSEIDCTDGRRLRALFVPQPPQSLKVFGHVGEARFDAVAHLLGTEPPPPPPSLAPHAPPPTLQQLPR